MSRRGSELSTLGVFSISLTVALIGLAAYMVITPVTPADRIAVAFAEVHQPIILR